MASRPSQLLDHCLELLAPLGRLRSRGMFGGYGLYADDLFFALIAFDRLYLKANDQTRPQFEAAGCEPFVYDAKGKAVSLGYWTAPAEAMESPALMLTWARLALQAALAARVAKPVRAVKAVKPARSRGTGAASAKTAASARRPKKV